MKFVDEVTIEVTSGKGGDGKVAFRQEKFVPMGGPSGGDGGRGGDIILEATDRLTTLYELSYKRKHRADDGENGRYKDQFGANAENLVIKVPLGTLVFDPETDKLLVDLEELGQTTVIAPGGRGGRGNARFVSSVQRAPRVAEKGAPGKTVKLRLELKLLADVGLVGLPNSGKSTFIRAVSNAKPRVADYPFTTLIPNLGIVKPDGFTSFCMADIPGLIEGAHQGAGLGIQFLKHVERTRILLHLVDTSQLDLDPDEILKPYDAIQEELRQFSPLLGEKPVVVAANKMDLPDSRELLPTFRAALKERGVELFAISGATKEGVKELLSFLSVKVKELDAPIAFVPNQEETLYEYLPPFVIDRSKDGLVVSGTNIEKLVAMTNLASHEAILRFKLKLKKMGFLDALRKIDADDEEVVYIGDSEFSYWEFFD